MYGSSYSFTPSTQVDRVTRRDFDGYTTQSTYRLDKVFPEHGKESFNRTGTNRNSARTQMGICTKTQAKVEPFAVQLARISQPKILKNLKTGKYYYKRVKPDFVKFPRVKMVKTPKKKFAMTASLIPNDLTYSGYMNAYTKPTLAKVAIVGDNGNQLREVITLSGDLFTGWTPGMYQTAIMGPNAQSLSGSVIPQGVMSLEVDADKAALAKLYSKAKNQSVNLLQALAERRQTMNLFVELATKVAKALLKAKSGDAVGAIRALAWAKPKDVANDWLLLQYGLLPLLSDLDGVAKELATGEDVQFDVVSKVRRSLNAPAITKYPFNHSVVAGYSEVIESGFVEVTYKTRCRVKSISREFHRLGFGNLSSIAWELSPWSFVADWFLAYGNFLNTMDAFSGVEVLWTTKTVFRKGHTTLFRHYGGVQGRYATSPLVTGFVNESTYCKRTVLTTVPALQFPSFKNPVSFGHLANALALFAQLKRK